LNATFRFDYYRFFFKTVFTEITDFQVKQTQEKLYLKPRKRFNYENPMFIINKSLFNDELTFITLIQIPSKTLYYEKTITSYVISFYTYI
jgi:hypothetical protein